MFAIDINEFNFIIMPLNKTQRYTKDSKTDLYGQILADYACDPDKSRGRLFIENESSYRSVFQRDRDRIIHCSAFRRLKHKTQVFVYHEGDYYRTRLTHSLEVAQIARTVSRALGLNEDLAEALALAHDFGHTPFGHAGEEALDSLMKPFGGFDHNAQTLRIVTKLERRYPKFDGLNLSWETLEGLVKHNGPLTGSLARTNKLIPGAISDYVLEHDLELGTFASGEAQVAALADDIAYNCHDIDVGLRAGLFDISDLNELPMVGEAFTRMSDLYGKIERPRFIHVTISHIIGLMVEDLLSETRNKISKNKIKSVDDVRELKFPLVCFSEDLYESDQALKRFLLERMYRHKKVNKMTSRARRVIKDVFSLLFDSPEHLPHEWRDRAEVSDDSIKARIIADYIAGMTDRYALNMHQQFFDPGVL